MNKLSKSGIALDSLCATLFSGLGKSSAAIIPFFIAAWFIDQHQTDVFFYVNTIVMFFYGLFSITVEAISVPFFSKEKLHTNISDIFWRLSLILSLIIIIISGLLYLNFDYIFIESSSFSKSQLLLAADLFVILIPFVTFSIFNSILVSIYYVNGEFQLSSLLSGLRFVIALLFGYLFKNKIGIKSVAIGYSLGEILRSALMLYSAHSRQYIAFTRPNLNLSAAEIKYFKHFLLNATGMIFIGLNPIVTKSLASKFGSGAVSAIEYSERLGMLPSTVFGLGTSSVLFAYWTSSYHTDSLSNFKKKFYKTNGYIAIGTLLFLAICIIFADNFLPIFLPKSLLLDSYHIKQLVMLYLSVNLPYILQGNLARVQFIRQTQRFYVIVQIVSTLLYFLLANQLSVFWGLNGLIISWLITTFFLLAVYFYGFCKLR